MRTRHRLSKDEQAFRARQRVVCRCAECGELLALDVSLSKASRLIARHRKTAHPDRDAPQRGNRARRDAADKQLLDALPSKWITVRELQRKLGVSEMSTRKRLARLEAEGRVECHQATNDTPVFRRKR